MTIYIAAWHYWARVVVQRAWGWSPIEELVLLHLDTIPGTMDSVTRDLGLNAQVVLATIARLMQFGLVEPKTSPELLFSTSDAGRNFLRSGRSLPERTTDREVAVSLVYERVGQSVFKRRDVNLVPAGAIGPIDAAVRFTRDEPDETDETMSLRVGRFMAGSLRPGEWLRGVRAVNSVLSRRYLAINLEDARSGVFPEGASEMLVSALRATLATGILPTPAPVDRTPPPPIEIEFRAESLILGSTVHVDRFVEIVGKATKDVFVLSTFVAPQADEKGRDQRDRIINSLDQAIRRGVRCHLFFGTSIDETKHSLAMEEIRVRLSRGGLTRGFLLVHRDSVRSHTKFLAADDGEGGVVVVLGSCNWLSSPFAAVEASVDLTNGEGAVVCLDLLRKIVVSLSNASRSVETLRFMAAESRRALLDMTCCRGPSSGESRARLKIVYAAEHGHLLRTAAHEANERFVCCTNRVGANMVPALFTPAEMAGRRLDDVRVYYSRIMKPMRKRHVIEQRERLHEKVELIGVRDPQLHCKFLLWDDDNVVISTLNWGSQTGHPSDPLDEIGLYLKGPQLAAKFLERLEAILPGAKKVSDHDL